MQPRPSTRREEGEGSDYGSIDVDESSELGYMTHGPGALREVDGANSGSRPLKERVDTTHHSQQNQRTTQRMLPKKSIIDSLIDLFFKNINRVYGMIYEPIFRRDYDLWWSQLYDTGMTTDFALLILRLCILSAQSAKGLDKNSAIHQNHLSDTLTSPVNLEQRLCRIAEDLESRRSRKHSIVVVQHMFFHVCYLKNRGQIKESWILLADTVREAHEIGLHLEKSPGPGVSELDQELWRRAFWNLYVWDRFMSTFLGRWPLIPEDHCDIDLPHDNIQAITTNPNILTQYTDRLFQARIARFISHTMGSKTWKKDQYDPATVAHNIHIFEENIIHQLPSALSVTNPDKTWDIALPSLAMKREALHMAIYSAVAGLYRGFANPWELAIETTDINEEKGGCEDLNVLYYCNLMTELCKVLDSSMKLYDMQPGSQTEGFFMAPMSMVEALSQVGLCFRASQSGKAARWGCQNPDMARKIDHQLRFDVCEKFQEAFRMLDDHSSESKIAKHGAHILSELALEIGSYYEKEQTVFRPAESPSYEQLVEDFDWTQFITSPDRSWFFEGLFTECEN